MKKMLYILLLFYGVQAMDQTPQDVYILEKRALESLEEILLTSIDNAINAGITEAENALFFRYIEFYSQLELFNINNLFQTLSFSTPRKVAFGLIKDTILQDEKLRLAAHKMRNHNEDKKLIDAAFQNFKERYAEIIEQNFRPAIMDFSKENTNVIHFFKRHAAQNKVSLSELRAAWFLQAYLFQLIDEVIDGKRFNESKVGPHEPGSLESRPW